MTLNPSSPIDCMLTVLDLLCRRRGDDTKRRIEQWRHSRIKFVEIEHFHDFSDSFFTRINVTDRVVEELVTTKCVEGQKRWGHTDMRILSISEAGERRLWEERKRLGLDYWFQAELWIEAGAPAALGASVPR